MGLSLIHTSTVKNFNYLDHRLNLKAEKSARQHAIQLLSYFTHPADLVVKSIAYPAFRVANPFITVGINLMNGKWTRAALSTVSIPHKLAIACIAIVNFQGQQGIRLLWSLSGANMASNVIRGAKQRNAFFAKRSIDTLFSEMNNISRERLHLTPKKVYNLALPEAYQIHLSPDAPEEDVNPKMEEILELYQDNAPLRSHFKGPAVLGLNIINWCLNRTFTNGGW